MAPFSAPLLLALARIAGCSGGSSEDEAPPVGERPEADAGPLPDAASDAIAPSEGERDAAPVTEPDVGEEPPPLPEREGINDRWALLADCELADLKLADQQLYALCRGNKHRLVTCPLAQSLEPVACENVAVFEACAPSVHTVIDEAFSVITCAAGGHAAGDENRPGVVIVDRVARSITEEEAFDFQEEGLRIGNDFYPFAPAIPHGAAVLGSTLLVAMRNREAPAADGNFLPWPLLALGWMGNGTTEFSPHYLDENFLAPTHFGAAQFLPRADGVSAWLINGGGPSSFDLLFLDENGKVQIDWERNVELGEMVLEPLPALATDPAEGKVLLASGGNLVMANPETADLLSVPVAQAPLKAIQWAPQSSVPEVFVTDAALQVHRLRFDAAGLPQPAGSLSVYGEASGPLALDPAGFSGCLLYQGVVLEGGASAVTLLPCDAFDRL